METNPKNYTRPHTVEEATRVLENAVAFPLSGGAMALGMLDLPYETIVDLQDINDLNKIHLMDSGITIGSTVMLQRIVETPDIPLAFRRALTRSIPLNIRNNTSVIETLLISQPPPEWFAVLAAYDVTVNIMDYDLEHQQFPITETMLIAGEMGKKLRDGLVMSIHLPALHAGEAIGTAHLARTPAGDPIMNAAVMVKLHPQHNTVLAAYGALYGASEKCYMEVFSLDMYNEPLTLETIAKHAAQVPHIVEPPNNYLGSSEYRKVMSEILVKRALKDAAAQLESEN